MYASIIFLFFFTVFVFLFQLTGVNSTGPKQNELLKP